jgi:hypothetical protein
VTVKKAVRAPFQPKREDGRPQWQVVLDWITEEQHAGRLAIGGTIAHDDLLGVLGMESRNADYYQAVTRATREMEKQHGRSLRSERGHGYQLIAGMAQMEKGEGFQHQARSRMRRALAAVETVDLGQIEEMDQRTLVGKVRAGMVAIATVLDMHAAKAAEHDREIQDLKSSRVDDSARVRRLEEEMKDLRERLARQD